MFTFESSIYRRTIVRGMKDGVPTTQVVVVPLADVLALVAITTMYAGDENPTERLLALVPNYYRNELITRAARLEAADLVNAPSLPVGDVEPGKDSMGALKAAAVALRTIANCLPAADGSVTLGAWEQSVVRTVLKQVEVAA
jgi:hypothetical protein